MKNPRAWVGLTKSWLLFIGRAALFWGGVTIGSGLMTFALDLALALALQRFFVSIGLIGASGTPGAALPVQAPGTEALVFLVIGTLRCGATWLNTAATGLSSLAFETRKRRDIMLWALGKGNVGIGRVMTLFGDLVLGASAAVSNVFFLISRSLLAFCVVVTLAYYSLPLTGMLLIVLLLAVPLHQLVGRRLARDSRVIQKALADVVERLVAAVKNSVFLQVHGMVGSESRRGVELISLYASASVRYQTDSATRSAVPQVLGLFVVVGIALQGSVMLGDDKGAIVVYLYLALRMFQNFGDLTRYVTNFRLNLPRLILLRRWWLNEMLPARDLLRVVRTDAEKFPSPIGWRVEDVSFSWEPQTPVIRNQSFQIEPRTITAVIGPSGAGKSTLLLLLAGLLRPQEGAIDVLLDGEALSLATVRDRLLASSAYVGPEPFTVPGTIRDFLVFGHTETIDDQKALAALRTAHCDFVEMLPRGLDHVLTEQGGGLSAGQKQRLALARALLRQPKVLLLDEATANLDMETEWLIIQTLRELKAEMTIVAVTHRQALLEVADQVIEIAPGVPVEIKNLAQSIPEPVSVLSERS